MVNNRNTRKRQGICSKLIIKTPERCSTIFFLSSLSSHLFLVFLLLTCWYHSINLKKLKLLTVAIINRCIKILAKWQPIIWHVSTNSYIVSENMLFSTKALLILLMSGVFCKKNRVFWPKQYLYSKQQCESFVNDFLVLFSVFIR